MAVKAEGGQGIKNIYKLYYICHHSLKTKRRQGNDQLQSDFLKFIAKEKLTSAK